jgi:hypothetical protein
VRKFHPPTPQWTKDRRNIVSKRGNKTAGQCPEIRRDGGITLIKFEGSNREEDNPEDSSKLSYVLTNRLAHPLLVKRMNLFHSHVTRSGIHNLF